MISLSPCRCTIELQAPLTPAGTTRITYRRSPSSSSETLSYPPTTPHPTACPTPACSQALSPSPCPPGGHLKGRLPAQQQAHLSSQSARQSRLQQQQHSAPRTCRMPCRRCLDSAGTSTGSCQVRHRLQALTLEVTWSPVWPWCCNCAAVAVESWTTVVSHHPD